MKDTAERRIKILELLCERQKVKVGELVIEFNICVRTIH